MSKLLFLLAALTLVLVGCGDGEPDPAAAPDEDAEAAEDAEDAEAAGTVSVYTSVPEPIIEALRRAFEERHPELELSIFRGSTGDVQARLATEQQTGQVRADLIWIAEPSAYEDFKQSGLLAQYSPPADAPIPAAYIDADGYYVAGRVINMVVAWNTDLHPDGMTDWSDLPDPDARAVFPAPTSGSALAAIWGLLNHFDEDYFHEFVAAGGTQVSSNGAARDGIISGEFGSAGVLDYMIRDARAEGSPVDFAYPASGTVVIPSPLGITADAQNPAGAQVFADFILSKEGQELVVELGSFYPARDDVAPPEGAPPLGEIETIEVDWVKLVDDTDDIDRLWTELLGG